MYLMKGIYKVALFEGLDETFIDLLLDRSYRIQKYEAGVLLAVQGDAYKSLLIVSEGMLRAEMTNPDGAKIIVEDIKAPRAVAPAFLYAKNNTLPVSIFTVQPSVIVSIPRKNLSEMMQQNEKVLENYLRDISDRSRFLSNRLRLITFGTIKNKLINYFMELDSNSRQKSLNIPHTHQELADMFGVTRPALTRAIRQLEKDGIIRKNGIRTYTLLK